MTTCKLLLFLTIVATSCQDSQEIKEVTVRSEDTIAKLKKNDTAKLHRTQVAEPFSSFWKRFRSAVIASDTNQVLEMAEFPFQTRGSLDSDPIIKYNREMFIPVFKVFLNQWNGMDLDGTTELELIKQTKTPNEKNVRNNSARIGNLVFTKTQEWKLTFIYLNNDTIDSLEK